MLRHVQCYIQHAADSWPKCNVLMMALMWIKANLANVRVDSEWSLVFEHHAFCPLLLKADKPDSTVNTSTTP